MTSGAHERSHVFCKTVLLPAGIAATGFGQQIFTQISGDSAEESPESAKQEERRWSL